MVSSAQGSKIMPTSEMLWKKKVEKVEKVRLLKPIAEKCYIHTRYESLLLNHVQCVFSTNKYT